MTQENLKQLCCLSLHQFSKMFNKIRPSFTQEYIDYKFDFMRDNLGSFLLGIDQELFKDITLYLQERNNDK